MAIAAHLRELNNKHANLDIEIEKELQHPAPNTTRLSELKKQKFQLKQKISSLQSG